MSECAKIEKMEKNAWKCFFDLETTGLSCHHDEITQIGAILTRVDPDTQKTVEFEFETLVKCQKPLCNKVIEITGITPEMLKSAPPTKEALNSFVEFIQKNTANDDAPVYLVGYNSNEYDCPLLFSEMHRWGMNPGQVLLTLRVSKLIDGLKYARTKVDSTCLLRKSNGKPKLKLGDVHMALTGNPICDAHTALADSLALRTVCENEEFDGIFHEVSSSHCLRTEEFVDSWAKKRKSIDDTMIKKKDTQIKRAIGLFSLLKKRKREDVGENTAVMKKQK